MTLANVGLLADCWLIVGWQPTSKNVAPVRDIGIYMYVCWSVGCFWAFLFFLPLFSRKTDFGNSQQTNKPTLGQNSLRSFALERI
jgi:hypothetical protein